jgi:uncharacterized pyridoxal phosphate-containing UPF0001 family protein
MTTIAANLASRPGAGIRRCARRAGTTPESVRPAGGQQDLAAERSRKRLRPASAQFRRKLCAGRHCRQDRGTCAIALEWHFIGPLQSNKTRPVAEHFDWVHSIDRLKVAERLSAQRPAACRRCRSASRSTSAAKPARAACARRRRLALAHAVAALPNLRLRGLMAIPEPSEDPAVTARRFPMLRELREQAQRRRTGPRHPVHGHVARPGAAIAEGATIVRVGTAIFGERNGNRA